MPAKTVKNSKARAGKTRKNTMKVKVTKTINVKPLPDQQKANVLAVVRRMISRGIANKTVGYQIEDNVKHNSTISAADCYPIIPQIYPDGTADVPTTQLRSTDRIKPKSLVVRGTIGLQYVGGTAPTSLPMYVKVMILQQKDIKNSGAVTGSVDTGNLLHAALPTTTVGGIPTLNDQISFNGTLSALHYPVNTNKFKVFMNKTFYLHTPDISHSNGADAPGFSKSFMYIFKDMPTNLTFDEGAGNYVNNFAPFIAIGWCYADGTSASSTTTLLNANIYSQLVFEDA